jgi:hypothetical protein
MSPLSSVQSCRGGGTNFLNCTRHSPKEVGLRFELTGLFPARGVTERQISEKLSLLRVSPATFRLASRLTLLARAGNIAKEATSSVQPAPGFSSLVGKWAGRPTPHESSVQITISGIRRTQPGCRNSPLLYKEPSQPIGFEIAHGRCPHRARSEWRCGSDADNDSGRNRMAHYWSGLRRLVLCAD